MLKNQQVEVTRTEHKSRSCALKTRNYRHFGRSALTENKYSKTYIGYIANIVRWGFFSRLPGVYTHAASAGPERDPRIVTSPESMKGAFFAIKAIYRPEFNEIVCRPQSE